MSQSNVQELGTRSGVELPPVLGPAMLSVLCLGLEAELGWNLTWILTHGTNCVAAFGGKSLLIRPNQTQTRRSPPNRPSERLTGRVVRGMDVDERRTRRRPG